MSSVQIANDSIVSDTTAALPLSLKTSINIILLGETNVGKTAIIDLLANVLTGVKLEDFKPAHAEWNEQDSSSTGSRTKKPVMYSIKRADGHTVNVLDTQGLADSRGIDVDNQHKEAIVNAINDNMDFIDSVIVIANGTLPRLSVTTEYVLAVISSMFPNSFADKVAFLFTMVASPLCFNFERKWLPQELQKAPLWPIDNPFAQWMKYQEKLHADSQTDEDVLENMLHHVESSYKGMLQLLEERIFKWIDATSATPTSFVYKLHLMSTEIEATISNVIARTDQIEHKQPQLLTLKADKETQQQMQRVYEKYSEIASRSYYEQQTTNDHNVLCVQAGCYSNCHIGCGSICGISMDRETLGTNCSAFANSTGQGKKRICNQCGHCAEDHQYYRCKWVKKTETVRQVDEDAKRRYADANTELEKIEMLVRAVEKELESLGGELVELEKELSELCGKYDNFVLSGSLVGHVSSAIRLLELREETMRRDDAPRRALERVGECIKRMKNKKLAVVFADKQREKEKN